MVPPDKAASEKDPASHGQVQSIARAFTVLETVARAEAAIGVTEIAAQTGLPTGTVYRMASTLVDLGYLIKNQRSKYSIGSRVLLLAKANDDALASLARGYLDELAARFGETVAIGTLQDDAIMYLAQAAGARTLRMFTSIGERIHPHCTAIGKALMADWSEPKVRALLQRTGMPAYSPHTITDPDDFLTVLAATKARGYALNEGEQEEGMRCISVVIPYSGRPLAFSLSAPAPRLTDRIIADYLPHLVDRADALATDLYEHTAR